jgi:uncharacterized repeat protein (TIGR02543 family)
MTVRALPRAARWGHAARFIAASLLLGASLMVSANTHAAKLSVGKSGHGTVNSSPSGIQCGRRCSAHYAKGTQVTLTPKAAKGYSFAGWSGACSGSSKSCTVSMNGARRVTATFTPNAQNVVNDYALSVAIAGAGTVTSSPGGINCGTNCSASYVNGTNVTLTASPATGYSFSGWSGACSGAGASCTVSMTDARSITAIFSQNVVQYSLSVTTSGVGTVTSSPSGIICGTNCSASYASGTNITLTAGAATGYSFSGWSGACSGAGASCTVSMTDARSVTAFFSQNVVTDTPIVSVTPTQCSGSGLAELDLAGQCRASPGTMGALEAADPGTLAGL